MNNSSLPLWLALFVLVAAGYGGWKWWQVKQFRESLSLGQLVMEDGPPLEDFELTERSGKPFRSADMKGKVWVTTFFFATCQGTCPRLNSHIKYMNSLEELKDVTWVSITVDPQADKVPKLQEYAERFQADPERWLFCRGEFDYIRRVGQDFMKVPISWQGHNDFATVIDKQGKIRTWHDMSRTSELEKLREVLVECLEEETADSEKSDEVATDSQPEQVDQESSVEPPAEDPQPEPAAA